MLTINIHNIRVQVIHSIGSLNIGKTIISRNQAKTTLQEVEKEDKPVTA